MTFGRASGRMIGGARMKNAVYTFVLLASTAAAFLTGSWWNVRSAGGAATVGAEIRHGYACPMHPQYRADRPGDCPVCGMRLEATNDGGAPVIAVPGAFAVPGTVHVDSEGQRLAGVTVADVTRQSTEHAVRLVGHVQPGETLTYTVTSGINGLVREVSSVTTGSRVRKGQYLATISAPDAFAMLQTYLVALKAIDHLNLGGPEGAIQAQASEASANFQQRLDSLHNAGMSEAQIAEVRRTRQLPTSIRIVSPADGFVLARHISPGQRFERGMDWYRIADLRHVWIQAEIIGTDADYVRPGLRVKVSVPGGRTSLDAHVSGALPQFDPATRTLKVRLEAPNPGYVLRPDMVVDVEVPVVLPPAIVVPVDAILDSGMRKTVFVARGEGVFEPREVRTGWRFGGQVGIVEGLTPGERIVTSGTFLIDSESRMRLAAAPLAGTPNH